MKITIYELLGMVKDDKAPYKVKYQNEIYIMDDLEYFYVNNENKTPLFESIFDNYSDYDALNEEIEILDNLEEKKIPEKLTQFEAPFLKGDKPDIRFSLIIDQINEIIDYLDYLKSKGE